MGKFVIEGGLSLKGEITPQGAKNEALQILCATLLTSDRITIHKLPRILDVLLLIQLLRDLGVQVEELGNNSYSFRAEEVDPDYFLTEAYLQQSAALRGSVMILGPLLARYGKAVLPKPGGDKIGRRRLDTHFLGFQALGARFDFDHSENFYQVNASHLEGTYIHLDEASVMNLTSNSFAACL
jgi:UDP-N-acetylglucosamine 1-carboxyvinyltransferase